MTAPMAEPGHLLAVVTDVISGAEEIEEIGRRTNGGAIELRLVAPAVEATSFRHTLGDIDVPKVEAKERLQRSLEALRASGIEASGEIGDPDPVQAAQDALRERPADEILIFERRGGNARWFEDGLFEKAKENLEPPLRMVVVEAGGAEDPQIVDVEQAARGTEPVAGDDVDSAYLPAFSRADMIGIAIAISGTVAAALLAAAAATGDGPDSGWKAVAILVAIGIALVNLAHVVGLTFFEAVRYRGGFAKLFRTLSLVGTPLAVLINLAILLFS